MTFGPPWKCKWRIASKDKAVGPSAAVKILTDLQNSFTTL